MQTLSSYFRTTPSPPSESSFDTLESEEMKDEEKYEKSFFCKQCGHPVTRQEDMIQVNGSHEYTFANPNGFVFHIGCFRTAHGCSYTGRATLEWSWFAGWKWRVAVCGRCLVQLGWLFIPASMGEQFNGLILDRLTSPLDPGTH